MLTKEEFTCLARKYMDTVFRVAMNYLKNKTDADDVTQNVLLKFYKSDVDFESEEHVKHWLIRVTLNECKNFLRFPWQKYGNFADAGAGTSGNVECCDGTADKISHDSVSVLL